MVQGRDFFAQGLQGRARGLAGPDVPDLRRNTVERAGQDVHALGDQGFQALGIVVVAAMAAMAFAVTAVAAATFMALPVLPVTTTFFVRTTMAAATLMPLSVISMAAAPIMPFAVTPAAPMAATMSLLRAIHLRQRARL